MSHRDLLNSTSRSAMILGMTNTDQVGMWQARSPVAARVPEPEVLPDAGDGGGDPGGGDGGGDIDEATGLTADELAQFEAMRTGDAPDPGPAGDDDGGDPDGEPDADPAEPDPAAAARVPQTPEELAAAAQTGKKPQTTGAPRTISLGKHQRELKAAQDRATAAEERAQKALLDAAKLGERVNIINEALQARAQQQQVEEPDPNAPPANPFEEADIDPEEDYAGSVKQIQRRQRYQNEQAGRVEQTVVESREDQQVRETFIRDFQATQAQPEFAYAGQAYQFVKDQRLTQICLSEFDKDPNDPNEQFTREELHKAIQIFNTEEKWLIGNAIKQGKSPTQAILKQARVYGFKPQAAAPAAAAPAPAAAPAAARRPAAPAAPAARVPARPADAAQQELAALRQAQQDGRSLSDGGGVPPQGLSAEMLLQLSDEEFGEMIDSMSPGQLNALMGRGPG